MKFNKPGIEELFNKEKLEEIQDKIGKATGLAFVTVDYTGNPITKMSCFVDFCKCMRSDEKCCEICKKSDAFGALQAAISHRPFVYHCPRGFLEVAIPIEYDGAFLGGFIGGQVICEDAPQETVRLSQLFDQGDEPVISEELLKLKDSARKYPYAQYMDVVNLIHLIVSQFYEVNASKFKESGSPEEFEELHKEKAELKSRVAHLEHKLAHIQNSQNQFFLSNVLSTISGSAILENAEKTEELILLLNDYFLLSAQDPENFWSLEEELELCRKYILLTCSKFGDRFSYQIHMADRLKSRRIMVYSVLPYLQNAIYYGIALKKEDANLSVSVSLDHKVLMIEITENGPGLNNDELRETFSGYHGMHEGVFIDRLILRTEKRLIDHYGEEFRPVISVGKGVGRKFRIMIPVATDEA